MQRLAIIVLAVVVAFVTGLAGLLFVKGRAINPEPPEHVSSSADYRIEEVHIQEEAAGNVRWRLDADYAEVFQQQGKTLMRKVTVTIIEPHRTWTVTGDEGELLEASKNVRLRRNVVLVSSEGLRLEAETLNWEAEGRRVWSDDPVTLIRNNAALKGRSLETRMDEERTTVKGPLRVTIHRERSVPVSLFTAPPGAS